MFVLAAAIANVAHTTTTAATDDYDKVNATAADDDESLYSLVSTAIHF